MCDDCLSIQQQSIARENRHISSAFDMVVRTPKICRHASLALGYHRVDLASRETHLDVLLCLAHIILVQAQGHLNACVGMGVWVWVGRCVHAPSACM